MSFVVRNRASKPQELLIDTAVHFVKARGTGRKVFKLKRLRLGAGEAAELGTSFSLAVHTTRVPRPGRHAVEVIVNGTVHDAGAFTVTGAPRR
jgi:hypothetical protein